MKKIHSLIKLNGVIFRSTPVKKNLIVLFSLFLIVSFVNADDLIVDKNALSQYETDEYLLFDVFDANSYHQYREKAWPHGLKSNSDQIDLSDNAPVLGAQFTQEAWIYSDSTTTTAYNVFSDPWNLATSGPTIHIMTTSGTSINEIKYGFITGGSTKITNVTVDIPVKVWHHIATTFDGTNYKLFINGVEVNNYTGASGTTPTATPVRYIGTNFEGKMDEIRMWNVARTQSEIQDNMDKTLAGNESGLVAYYPVDLNNNWELVDHSPNENHVPMSNTEVASKYFSNDCPAPDGSSNCPYPTIRSALDDARAGDRIYIREGRYTELLNKWQLNHLPEAEGQKIVIEGYPNEDVIIDGTISINASWEPYTHNGHAIYKAVLDMNSISQSIKTQVDSIYGVFVDGRYMIPAMPTNFKNPTDPTTGNPKNPEPGTVWALRMKSPIKYPEEGYQPGNLANLDTLEEWSFNPDNNTLYLYASDDYIPTSTNVRVRVRDRILAFSFSDNFEFKNLHFFAGSVEFYSSSYTTIEDCKFSFSSDMGLEGNMVTWGYNTTVRNCIFEYINDASPWYQTRTMFPTMENILFRYNDWFSASGHYGVTTRNYRGARADGSFVTGGSQWRYLTIENSFTAGIYPAIESLTEYCRFENLYEQIDGSGIQRNPISVPGSTTRYTWIINAPHLNGMRFDGSCAGTYGDVHHVVSVGNNRGFRLKGNYHDVHHVIAYDNNKQDISLPYNKYCGPSGTGDKEEGNWNSNFHNSIAEFRLECSSPDCWPPGSDPNYYGSEGYKYPLDASHLDSVGIWYGLALDITSAHAYAYPHFELMDPWIQNRSRSEESLFGQFGENPFVDSKQNYDFRPKKGSNLVDAGVIIPGVNDGVDGDLNHPPLYPGQNRRFVGDAPDIGAYEYGDSVYWIPGYRYPYPSVPIPKNNAVNVPMDYGLAWNYPYKKDYSGTTATVSLSGPGVNRTESFDYPYNVLFETFQPGGTYNWSVSVDGVSGGSWTFQVEDEIYPTNDRSIATAVTSPVLPYQTKNLQVSINHAAFLRFDISESVNASYKTSLNLVPETVNSLTGGIVLYKYNLKGWGEKIDGNNIGVVDHVFGTPIDTLSSLVSGSKISLDLSGVINSSGEHSFALGVIDSEDSVSFYSKEKLITDGQTVGYSSGYAPQTSVWPSLSFSQDSLSVAYDVSLTEGWNLISVPYDGLKSHPESIFGTLIKNNQLVYVSSMKGYYRPNDAYATLDTISSKGGYYIKVTGSASKIYFRGRAFADNSISLTQGWNLISYYPDYELNIEEAFS
ncbi:MAG TPA: LamG domain-containing protein, partial [Candidatus Marinimicrobia bacterium]|nr:LamG domain-containing protein [Candidatus Neomarinimicrobiota bacterium]